MKKVSKERWDTRHAWKLRIGMAPEVAVDEEAWHGLGRTHSKHPRDEGWQPRGCTTGKEQTVRTAVLVRRKRADKKQKTPRSHLGT